MTGITPEIQRTQYRPMAERIRHVRIDKPHQRHAARHRFIAHHMVNTLPLHDDAAQIGTGGQCARWRGPDQRHVALLACIIKKARDFKGGQTRFQRRPPQVDIGVASIKSDANHLSTYPDSAHIRQGIMIGMRHIIQLS
jgi:hypothetical protein